jgi:hypothetical protein
VAPSFLPFSLAALAEGKTFSLLELHPFRAPLFWTPDTFHYRENRAGQHDSHRSAFHVFLAGAPMFAGTPLLVEKKSGTASDRFREGECYLRGGPLEVKIRISPERKACAFLR